MRILSLCADTGIDVLGRKGASIHVREMIAAFARAGHSVELVAPRLQRAGCVEPAAPVDAVVRHVRVPDHGHAVKSDVHQWSQRIGADTSLAKDVRRMVYDQHLVERLDEMYATDPPDLIYARASLLSTAGADLARRTGRPLVVELNTPLADEQQRYRAGGLVDLYVAAERNLLQAAAGVTVVSEALVDHVVGLGVHRERVHVVPNGVDVGRFRPRADRPTADPVLGFVGGLRPWHGVEYLPELLALVQRRHPRARLTIVGDGPLGAEIRRRAEQCGVSDSLTMVGTIDHEQMPEVIAGFDIALAPYPVLPHDFYFSPLKLFEYLACAVPVVASDSGQIGGILGDGVHALLAPAGDVPALADRCVRLLDDPVVARRIGEAGARLVGERYTWDHNAAIVVGLAAGVAR
jgi:glycosyltransferase involved in cell wall biosynthesis